MSRERAADGRYCVRLSIGCSPIHVALLVRRFLSTVRHCFAPLRGPAADFAFASSTARAVITISTQARGERRAQRFNY